MTNKKRTKKYIVKKIILVFTVLILLTSCDAYKKVAYAQNEGTAVSYTDSTAGIPNPVLKTGDLIIITVNASTPELAEPFNLPLMPGGEGVKAYSPTTASGAGGSLQNYLIDVKGDINFPVLGKIRAAGMNKSQLESYISSKIYPAYIKEEPIVTIRFANFKVSVLGEVNSPGVYPVENEKINIFEAVAMAGDLTIYGKRDNLLLIRENENGTRQTVRIDLRDKRLIDSPYFYLQQNDVLYIQPNNPKARSGAISTVETMSLSVVGTLISITTLVVTLLKN